MFGLVGAAVMFIAIAGVALHGWYHAEPNQVRRALRAAQRFSIATFPDGGTGRVVGKAVLTQPPLRAPLSGRACVYYEVIVEQHHGKNGWRRVLREVQGVAFAVEDGTGRALVDPTHARIRLTEDHEARSGTLDEASAAEEALLARHGLQSKGWVFNKSLRYREGVIEVGEAVSVYGGGVREPDPDAIGQVGGYRESPPTRLRLGGAAGMPLLLSDDPDVLA